MSRAFQFMTARRGNIAMAAAVVLAAVLSFARSVGAMELQDFDFFRNHPRLLELSSLSLDVNKDERKPRRPNLGAFAVGGDGAFAVMGLDYPFNAYHNMTTWFHPFFGDSAARVEVDGRPVDFRKEGVWHVRGQAIAVTREENESLAMATVNFSPPGSGAIVRAVAVKAIQPASEIRIALDAAGARVEDAGAEIRQYRGSTSSNRTLTVGAFDPGARAENGRLVQDIPPLGAGEEAVRFFYCIISENGGSPDGVRERLLKDKDRLLSETLDYWDAYLDGSSRLVSPDDRLNEMMERFKIALKIQRTPSGGQGLTVKYAGRSHDRENVHVARFLQLMGMPGDARDVMMYGYKAALKTGVILNSRDLALDLSDLPENRDDWATVPLDDADADRKVAERPSWTVLQFYRQYKTTGDLELIRTVYPYLKRNLLGQAMTADGLLPFHGDEMYQITYPTYVSGARLSELNSFDSSVAFIAAASGLEEMARALNEPADAETFAALKEKTRAAAIQNYWLEKEGRWASGLKIDDRTPMTKPFPLIALQPETAGVDLDPDKQEKNLNALIDESLNKDGSLRMAPGTGLYHGQLQGMFLNSLKRFRHPLADRVFEILTRKMPDPAGSYSEVHAANHSHVSLNIDPTGLAKEDARRLGPWETALNLSAALNHLTGLSADAQDMSVGLEPVLPDGWPSWTLLDARIGDQTFDVSLERGNWSLTLRLLNNGPKPLRVRTNLPIGKGTLESLQINGGRVPLEKIRLSTNYGRSYIEGLEETVETEWTVVARLKP